MCCGLRSGGCVGFGCAGWRLRRRLRRRADRAHRRSRSADRAQTAAHAAEAGVPTGCPPCAGRITCSRSRSAARLPTLRRQNHMQPKPECRQAAHPNARFHLRGEVSAQLLPRALCACTAYLLHLLICVRAQLLVYILFVFCIYFIYY